MKKSLIIVAGVAILVLLAGFLVINLPSKNNTTNNQLIETQTQNTESLETLQDENCNVIFTEYLVKPEQVQKLGQIGVVHGSGKYIVERSYISVKPELTEQKIPIYAPAEMTLFAGAYYNNPATPSNFLPDYALKFDAGCGVEVALAHLKEVVPQIAEQLPEPKPDSRDNPIGPFTFKAGELIGYYIQQQGGVAGFDFITRDKKVVNQFINQERYENDRARNLINGVCPYDFYTGDKKTTYYNLLGGAGGTLFNVKECGNASRDKAGTISGMWFLEKEVNGSIYEGYKDGEYGSLISLAGDEEAVTIGNLGQTNTVRVYARDLTYKLPTEVREEHCYAFQSQQNPSNSAGYAYFKLIDNISMDVYYSSSGSCPTTFPSAGARRYWK